MVTFMKASSENNLAVFWRVIAHHFGHRWPRISAGFQSMRGKGATNWVDAGWGQIGQIRLNQYSVKGNLRRNGLQFCRLLKVKYLKN